MVVKYEGCIVFWIVDFMFDFEVVFVSVKVIFDVDVGKCIINSFLSVFWSLKIKLFLSLVFSVSCKYKVRVGDMLLKIVK